MDNENFVINVGAGKYKIEGNKILETVNMVSHNSIYLKDRTATIDFKIEKDTLIQSSTIKFGSMTQIFTQKWARVTE